MHETGRTGHRIIFPTDPWFDVSSALYESGFACVMTPSMVMRYNTFRYIANRKGINEFEATMKELAALDGISPRQAIVVHALLAEMGMIAVERKTKPYRYVLFLPSEWKHSVTPRAKARKNGDSATSTNPLVQW